MNDKYLFYPGCSLEGSAKAYYESLMAINEPLGLHLEEIHDWNCCGATEYLGVSLTPAYALIARNLALAYQQADGTHTVVAPCSACYLNLAKADFYMNERPSLGENVNTALAAGGLHYDPGSLDIRHLLDVIINDIGLDAVKAKVVRPLKGLRVAPYLGCMVPRPDYDHRWSNPEYPNELDRLLKVLGAEVIDFPLKTHCCGGHMTQIGPETAYKLINRLLSSADQYKADVMVTLCPMCQMNVDAYQGETNRHFQTNFQMPIIFFTQLIGLAFGLDPKTLGFGREFVSTKAMLGRIGLEAPEPIESAPSKKLRKKDGLPMPRMPGDSEEMSS
ncbi:MAG TPA: CoB--CoM heterodisulfide reductase iron-sulfur subunit B family protein [Anaerolineae bacterium]|nr:CoB--CoM heterodisulfide reductase iron-sulfur subunit B family protein [Anaerolineae bacterium]